MTLQDVLYADAGGVQLAFTVTGNGPIDIVLVPGLGGHLEFNEETPYYLARSRGSSPSGTSSSRHESERVG